MGARSSRFSSVNTSSPRFRARIGRVESRPPSSAASGNGLTCACMIAFLRGILFDKTYTYLSWGDYPRILRDEGPLPVHKYPAGRIWLPEITVVIGIQLQFATNLRARPRNQPNHVGKTRSRGGRSHAGRDSHHRRRPRGTVSDL